MTDEKIIKEWKESGKPLVQYILEGYTPLDKLEKWFESDQTSLCLICNKKWDGLVMICEHCGAKRIKDSYLNKIEWYIDYDDFKDKIQIFITRLEHFLDCKKRELNVEDTIDELEKCEWCDF